MTRSVTLVLSPVEHERHCVGHFQIPEYEGFWKGGDRVGVVIITLGVPIGWLLSCSAAAVNALASHHCCPSSTPGVDT